MINPCLLSAIFIVIFLAPVFKITMTVFDCGVTKPINSSAVSWEEDTSILRDPGGTNLLKWPKC